METLKMFGTSDDFIEVEGDFGCEEYPACEGAEFDLTTKDAAMRIHAVYAGTWGFAITAEDGEDMPAWPVRRTFGEDCPYSETLFIDTPDDTRITQAS